MAWADDHGAKILIRTSYPVRVGLRVACVAADVSMEGVLRAFVKAVADQDGSELRRIVNQLAPGTYLAKSAGTDDYARRYSGVIACDATGRYAGES